MNDHRPPPGGSYAALDLGTLRTRSLVSGSLAISDRASSVPAVDVSPDLDTVWPIRHGMVVSMGACHRLANTVLREAMPHDAWPLERVMLGVPVAATKVDRRAAQAAVARAAACPVVLVEEPLAAAVGSGMDITDPRPQLLLDVGAGIIEAVVIRDAAIADAGALQISASLDAGLPAHVLDAVTDLVADLVRRLPAHLRPAAREGGLLLTGGGAGQPELARRLCAGLRVTVNPALEPAHATIRGLARLCLLPALAAQVAALTG
ncbi:rod shape-determining protein [Nonomuraea sp. NPDC048916]|uniref:rod shape-determining protein n=1 Tax=Nonomuraea sp. NPDC048916 TaxID=3154232 RepID=UPI0033E3981F